MRRSRDFSAVVRSGARAGSRHLVVHQLRVAADPRQPPQVGLVVGRSVGNSVVRHRVSRRLRAQLAQRLPTVEAGTAIVVRALPAAADASSADLGRDLDSALAIATRRSSRAGSLR